MIETEAKAVFAEHERAVHYQIGTMVETPRATLTADRLVEHAELFSVGSNELTQTTYALSRDDAETTFLVDYPRMHLFDQNPFISLHGEGVGKLIDMAIASARAPPGRFRGRCLR
ncbi:MAG TPA: putative PEP-binding protein [Propionibacteriaceae bacterium]|nr:putative PEP-binding protein [Propionibacteriaceae bacterium]